MNRLLNFILLILFFPNLSQNKIQILFRTHISAIGTYLTMSGDGKCIAITSRWDNKATLYRNNQWNKIEKNFQLQFDLIGNRSDFDYYGKLQKNNIGLDSDCSYLYIKANQSFFQFNTKSLEYKNIVSHTYLLFKIVDTNLIYYDGYEMRVLDKQLMLIAQRYLGYSNENVLRLDLSVEENASVIIVFNSSQIRMHQSDYLQINPTTYSQEYYINNFYQIQFIQRGKYILLMQKSTKNFGFCELVLFVKDVLTIFPLEFKTSSQILLSGNRKVVAVIQYHDLTKVLIRLYNIENLIKFGERSQQLLTQLQIYEQNQISQVNLNKEGNIITYIRKISPSQNEIIMIQHEFGVEDYIRNYDDGSYYGFVNRILAIVAIALASTLLILITIFCFVIIRRAMLNRNRLKQQNSIYKQQNTFETGPSNIKL